MLSKEIKQIWQDNILDYSAAVNQSRAIPDARTGLKPIHRKILYEMYADKITHDKKFKKCAYMVGQIIARFSEHGDAATYDALVRLAQPWIQRYPLLDFHGNLGSQFGDGQAAMRYTESKLSSLAEDGLLSTLKKDTVDWMPNFTNEEQEPVTLPALFPGLFCLPNQGIGFAVAANFLTYNLSEVIQLIINYIETKELNIIQYDLASGGTIINPQIMEQIYKTGKGSVIVEAKYTIENNKIIYTELPFNVMLDDLIEDVAKLCDNGEITGVKKVYNDSGNNQLRFVVEVEKTANMNVVINQLFQKTALRNSYGINQVALVNNKPKLLTMLDMVNIYIEHNINCIEREYNFEYQKNAARIEILEGLKKALEDIENIIKLIKSSNDAKKAKEALIQKYLFTERQAQAILDMKLSKLANLEKIEVNNELEDKINQNLNYLEILSSEEKRNNVLIERLKVFDKKYGDKRRTNVQKKDISKSKEEREKELIPPEECVVITTKAGTIKRIPTSNFKTQKRNGKGIKTQEDITDNAIRTNTVDSLLLFTNKGNMYRLSVNDIPEGTNVSKGQSIKSLISMEAQEEVSIIYSVNREVKEKYVVFVTKNGMIKKTLIEEYIKTKKKSGIPAIKLKENDSLVSVFLINEEEIIIGTKCGYSIRFNSTEVSETGRVSMGVKGITLTEGDEVISGLPVEFNKQLAIFTEDGYGKRMNVAELPIQKRAGKGIKCVSKNEIIGSIISVQETDKILILGSKNSICISASEIPELSRVSLGNIIIKDSDIIDTSVV